MSKIYYGGIELGYVRTTRYSNTSEADKDNPDLLYRVDDLQVTSVLALEMIPAQVGETIQGLLKRVQEQLSRPRRPFRYEIAGSTVIDLTGGLDDANGPFPYGVSVELVAEASLLISWGIKIRRSDCDGKLNKILSNRWTETASIGDDHLTTFRRSGRLVVSSRNGVSADAFRALVTPKCGPSMVRQNAEYTLHENGLELAYSFTDKEQYIVPPFPAIKAKGQMSETTTNHTGAVRHGRITIELTGPPDVHKQVLLARCVEIAMARALQAGLQRNNGRIIAGGGITEELFENTVSLTMTWLMRPDNTRVISGQRTGFLTTLVSPGVGVYSNLTGGGATIAPNAPPAVNGNNQVTSGLAMKGGWVGQTLPGTVFGACIAPPTRGDLEWLQLVNAAFHDPCLANTIGNDDRSKLVKQPEKNKGTQTELRAATIRVTNSLPIESPVGSAYDSADQTNAIYDSYKVVCHYHHDSGRDVAPVMKKGVAGVAYRLSGEKMSLDVEFTAKRVGLPPVIPSPEAPGENSVGANWIYTHGTISPSQVEVSGDGVTLVHTVTGLLHFKAIDPCKVNIVAPVPPYLAGSYENEARLAAAFANNRIVFLNGQQAGRPLNVFCNYENQSSQGGQTAVAIGGSGGGFSGPSPR